MMDKITSQALADGYRAIIEASSIFADNRPRPNWNKSDIENPYRKELATHIAKLIWRWQKDIGAFCEIPHATVVLKFASVGRYKAFKERFGRDYNESVQIDYTPRDTAKDIIETVDLELPTDAELEYVTEISVVNSLGDSRTVRLPNPYPPPRKYPKCRTV